MRLNIFAKIFFPLVICFVLGWWWYQRPLPNQQVQAIEVRELFHQRALTIKFKESDQRFLTAESTNLSTLEVMPIVWPHPQKEQGLLFFIYQYPLPQKLRSYAPITMKFDAENLTFEVVSLFDKGVEFAHPRHAQFVDFNQDSQLDLIVSDHGHDVLPFKGGRVSFFSGGDDLSFKKQSADLPVGYWFSSCSARSRDNVSYTLLVSTGTSELAGAHVGARLVSHPELERSLPLPRELADPSYRRYLSCTFIDINGDAHEDLIMGQMDRPGQNESERMRDFLFINNGDFTFSAAPTPLPPKYGHQGWATIDLKSIDMDGDGDLDVISVSHNPKFTTGVVELFQNDSGRLVPGKTFHAVSARNFDVPLSYFIPRAHVLDLDGNGKLDVLFHTQQTGLDRDDFTRSSVHLFLQGEQGQFIDVSEHLSLNNLWLENVLPITMASGQSALLYIIKRTQMVIHTPTAHFKRLAADLLRP